MEFKYPEIKRLLEKRAEDVFFETNDDILRNKWKNNVEADLKQLGYDNFLVFCDEKNNTDYVIESNGFIGQILIVNWEDGFPKPYQMSVKAGKYGTNWFDDESNYPTIKLESTWKEIDINDLP